MVVGAVVIDLLDQHEAMDVIVHSLSGSSPLAVVSANLQHVYEFADRPDWSVTASTADAKATMVWMTLLDGMPLIRRAESLTGRKWPRLAGSELLAPILEKASSRGARVGFIGGPSDGQSRLHSFLAIRFPELRVSGVWTPSRSELVDSRKSTEIAASIRSAQVDLLVVGLGKPLQEEWIARYGHFTGAKVFLAFGAASDFLSGRIRRSPRLVTELGLEWMWRLMMEPRRLWRRYLLQGPPAWLRVRRSAYVK